MQRAMIYDENEKVWRTADGRGFGIIDDGMCPEEKNIGLRFAMRRVIVILI